MRSSSYLPQDLVIEGEDYNPTLASAGMSGSPDGGLFTPADAPGAGLVGCAYATYQFRIADYDLNSEVQLEWDDALPASGRLWLALANWDEDRWDWFAALPSVESIRPDSLDPYFTFGGDLLAVLLLEPGPALKLDRIRIGTQIPLVQLQVTGPRYNWASLNTSFDAGASSDPDGSALSFAWDWDGDGTFDDNSGADPTISHLFSSPGSFDVTLRATDADGASATAMARVSVASSWTRTLGGDKPDYFSAIAVAPDGTLWACGNSYIYQESTFSGGVLMLAHYAADGELLDEFYWATDSSNFSTHRADAIEMDSDGSFYVLGTVFASIYYGRTLQKFSPDGELLWTRLMDNSNLLLNDMELLNNELLLAGSYYDTALSAYVGYWERLDKDGVVIASGRSNEACSFNAVSYREGFTFPLLQELVLAGGTSGGDALLCHVPLDGSSPTAEYWAKASTYEYARDVAVRGSLPQDPTIYLAVTVFDSANNSYKLAQLRAGQDAATAFVPLGQVSIQSLAQLPGGMEMLFTDPASRPAYLNWNLAAELQSAYNYDTGFSATAQGCATYGADKIVTVGLQPVAAGNFGESFIPQTEAQAGVWTSLALSFISFDNYFVELHLENQSTVTHRTQNTGAGGGSDAWINLHDPGAI